MEAIVAELERDTSLPSWVHEVADLERRCTRAASLAGDDHAATPGTIGASVDVAWYAHDIAAWLDETPRAPSPAARRTEVVVWLDRDFDVCFGELPHDLAAAVSSLVAGRVRGAERAGNAIGGPRVRDALHEMGLVR
jgi:hypothetical protein